MIPKYEIMEHVKQYDLPANTIEKDYILNWLLFGITTSSELKNKWIFKGGTCLKKCYFEQYRFSEDLDFTILDPQHINEDFLKLVFGDISSWIYDESGIEMPVDDMHFEEYENPRGNIAIEGRIAYKGPMQRRGNMSKVKLDLSHDEILVQPAIASKIHHPYDDMITENLSIQTYCLEEIFAEKLRALIERMRPRDLYDVIHLHIDERWQPNRELLLQILKEKCRFKEVDVPTLELVNGMPGKNDLIADWNDMLAHQISGLEPWEHYWEKLPSLFEWLYGE